MSKKIKFGEMAKISPLQFVLSVTAVSIYIIGNVMTFKLVDLPFVNITVNTAVFTFPFVYVLSDIFSEVYGYTWSRITSYMAFAMNVLMVLLITLSILITPSQFWTHQVAYETVLGNTPRIALASMLAYVLGDLANDRVFAKMKIKHLGSMKGFGRRSILSSLAGQFADSMVFLPIAFLGQLPLVELWKMMIFQVILKTSIEILFLPLTKIIVTKVKEVDGHESVGIV